MKHRALATAALLFTACGGEEQSTPQKQYAAAVLEARIRFPLMLNLHEGIFATTCASTNGVCHNAKEYPDLHTTGNLLAAISAPCNADKSPSDIFDGCEPSADQIELDDGTWSSPISWIGSEEWNDTTHSMYRRIVLTNPPPQKIDRAAAKITRQKTTIAVLPHHLIVDRESTIAEVHDLYELDYDSLSAVQGGDPNHNGKLGSNDAWTLITPKRPTHSYLLARLKSEVPGTQMPPLSTTLNEAELLAITCWIETLNPTPTAFDPINYDQCGLAIEIP